jgi:hypothetical protein
MARRIDDQELENSLRILGQQLRSRFTELEPRLNLHRDRVVRQASLSLNAEQPSRWTRIFLPLAAAAAAGAFAFMLTLYTGGSDSAQPVPMLADNTAPEDDGDYFFSDSATDDSAFSELGEAESLAFEPESLDPEFPVYENEEDPIDEYDNYEAS